MARTARTRPHVVAVLAYDGMTGFEAGAAMEVFGYPWPGLPQPWYSLRLCAEGRRASTIGGGQLRTDHDLDDLARADTVIVPSVGDVTQPPSPAVVAALQTAARRGARMVSICSGAFALAGAGLLDGRPATTHWQYADRLRDTYPRVRVERAPLFVDDGDVLTSAGSAAGLDLCLHLVRLDHGAEVAGSIARRMVVPPHRAGGQAQFIEEPLPRDPDDDRVSASIDWATAHLDQAIDVATLAARASMSLRTYQRRFTAATGTSPARWLTERRVHRAQELLESTDLSVEQICAATGFATPITLRHHFRARLGTSPTAYRRAFRSQGA